MQENSIVALLFLFIGGAFVGTLLMNLGKLLFSKSQDNMKFDAKSFLYHFRYTIISFIALMILIIVIIPRLEG